MIQTVNSTCYDIFIGIDPGFTGAISVLKPGTITIHDMPITELDGKRYLNYYKLGEILSQYKGDSTFVVLEQVWAMPNEGVSSAFQFGVNYGVCLGIVGSLKLRHQLIPGSRWKGAYNLLNRPKNASIRVATKLYPSAVSAISHHGHSDALLLADYGKKLKT